MSSQIDAPSPIDLSRQLVEQLNELKAQAGMPSYRKLAAHTNYSRSALWRATRGSRLPSRDITVAIAVACGGQAAEWQHRWELAHEAVRPADSPATTGLGATVREPVAAVRSPSPRHHSQLWVVMLSAATVTLIAAGSIMAVAAAVNRTPTRRGSLIARPADGDDPYLRGCAVDQQRIEYQNVYWPNHQLYGWLELYHSHICGASWGYVFGPNSAEWKVTIVARRLPDNTTAPSSNQGDDPPNSWGNVLTTPRGSCVRVEAYITVGTARGATTTTACRPDSPSGGVGPPPTPAPPPPWQYTSSRHQHR